MTYIGQHSPATRAALCHYCGTAVEVGALYDVCEGCDTRNLFSDAQKEEWGSRPDLSFWTLPEMRAWLRRRQTDPDTLRLGGVA